MRNFIIFLLTITQALSIELGFKGYASDIKSTLSQLNDSKALLIGGIGIGLYSYDSHIQNLVQENRNNTSNEIAKFAKPFGDGKYILPSLGCLYLYGHFFKNKKAIRVSLLALESFVISNMFNQGIQFLSHRHRPNIGGSKEWDGPSFSSNHSSFPSGHSCSSFSIGGVIAREYDSKFIPQLVYAIAILTATSRVNDNAHWASDVFIGSCLGYFTAKAIVNLH